MIKEAGMALAQTAICAETGNFGLFLTFTLVPDGGPTVRRVAAAIPEITRRIADEQHEPSLVSALGIGAAAWNAVIGARCPEGLRPFEAVSDNGRSAPSTPADLFLHIHSNRPDANLALARAITKSLGASVAPVEEIMGFKTREARDLTGFVDGTENPKGPERAEVALLPDSSPFAGGSFVSLQRYVHDLDRWENLSVADQEKVIGRTKADDQELDDEVKPPTAHIARVVIEEDGEELEIVRHSLPYGMTGEHGLYFVAYCASPEPFHTMLRNMITRDGAGHHDHLMNFTKAVTGASFFVPSQDFLAAL